MLAAFPARVGQGGGDPDTKEPDTEYLHTVTSDPHTVNLARLKLKQIFVFPLTLSICTATTDIT